MAALLLLLGATLTWRILHPFRQERVAALTYDGKTTHRVGATAGVSPARTAGPPAAMGAAPPSAQPEQPVTHTAEMRRDLFWSALPAIQPDSLEASHAPSPEPTDPMTLVRDELARFRVFGAWEDAHGMAVFLERDKEILLVRKGDRIDGRFRVEEINRDRMTLEAEREKETVQVDLVDFYASAYGGLGVTEVSGGPEAMEAQEDAAAPEETAAPPLEEAPQEGAETPRQPAAKASGSERPLLPNLSPWSSSIPGMGTQSQ